MTAGRATTLRPRRCYDRTCWFDGCLPPCTCWPWASGSAPSGLGRAHFRAPLDAPAGLRRVFYADTWWGIAAIVWIGTGLTRLLAGLEKGTSYYVHNDFFLAKMALLVLILILELWPMMTLIRWRIQLGRGETVGTGAAAAIARISTIQAILIIL